MARGDVKTLSAATAIATAIFDGGLPLSLSLSLSLSKDNSTDRLANQYPSTSDPPGKRWSGERGVVCIYMYVMRLRCEDAGMQRGLFFPFRQPAGRSSSCSLPPSLPNRHFHFPKIGFPPAARAQRVMACSTLRFNGVVGGWVGKRA